MKISHLTCSGIKSASYSGPLDNVVLVRGKNRSGKTGILEALRLATTGTAMIGGTLDKQSLMIAGDASVLAVGDGVRCEWSYINGKRKHFIDFQGMPVKSISGPVPITVDDWWALTGDKRWAVIEGVIGLFKGSPPLDDLDQLKSKLEQLINAQSPPEYSGDSLAAIKSKLDSVANSIRNAEESTRAIDQANRFNSELDRRKQSAEARQSDLTAKLNAATGKQAAIKSIAKDLAKPIFEWQLEDDDLHGDLLWEAVEYAWTQSRSMFNAIGKRSVDAAINKAIEMFSGPVPAIENPMMPTRSNAKQVVVEKLSALLGPGWNTDTADTAERQIKACVDAAYSEVKSLQELLDFMKESTDSNSAEQPKEVPECIGNDAYTQLLSQRSNLQSEAARCQAWIDWLSGAESRAAKIQASKDTIEVVRKAHLAYQAARADYLSSAIDTIKVVANSMLSMMGWSEVSVDIEQVAKRNVLTISAGGVNVDAMSGGEALVYGVCVLNAIQEASTIACPILLVEAAELDTTTLSGLLAALKATRTKGNVLVAHWTGEFENCIDQQGKEIKI